MVRRCLVATLLVAYAAATVVTAAHAAGHAAARAYATPVGTAGDYLSRMDTDRDRRVSLSEFQSWMGYAFERMDRDGDGIVSAAELPGGRGRAISLVEHRHALAETFARQDRNHDGFLDARELAAPPR